MKYFLLVVVSLFMCHLNAQKSFMGLRFSVNIANAEFETFSNDEFNTLSAGMFGYTYEYILDTNWTIGAELLINKRGYLEKDAITKDEQGNWIELTDIKTKFSYLSIPIKTTYRTQGNFFGIASIGFMPSYLTRSKTYFDAKVNGYPLPSSNVDNKEALSKWDFGGLAEVGFGVRSSSGIIQFNTTFGYQHSFTKYKATPDGDLKQLQHYGYVITIAIKYLLGKNNL